MSPVGFLNLDIDTAMNIYTMIGGGAHQLLVVGGEDGEARAGDEVVVEASRHLRHGQDREYLLVERPCTLDSGHQARVSS